MTLFTNWYFILIQSLYQTHDTNKHKEQNQNKYSYSIFFKKKFEKKNPITIFILLKTRKRENKAIKRKQKFENFFLKSKNKKEREKNSSFGI
jgi:hypothetical protein